MSVPLFHIDAFTDRPFAGNPAAVCLLDAPADERWMQQVAAEMNLSETAFLSPEDAAYRLRWFTPTIEVDLCGHATLASAHALWESGALSADQIAQFNTRSGRLTATRNRAWIELDFPATVAEAVAAPAGLIAALGVRPAFVGQNQFDYLIEVATEAEVRALDPDFLALRQTRTRGVIVTARSESSEFDFVSRFFAPGAGIDEDPVTGSAHCCLGPYWQAKLGRSELIGYQASARGGVVRVRVAGDRVMLGGQAVTVVRGELA